MWEAKTLLLEKGFAVPIASFAHLKTEADLAALMARQKLLKDKHELEEHLKRKKEQLKLDEDIAAHMAKLMLSKLLQNHLIHKCQ